MTVDRTPAGVGTGTDTATDTAPVLSIGQVLRRLRADFDDVTISKIRYLESEGLVAPSRAASGYRKFSEADVDRLRFVLSAQRDHYLPLRVIKDRLSAADRGVPAALDRSSPNRPSPNGPTPPPRQPLVDPLSLLPNAEFTGPAAFARTGEILRASRDELLADAGIDDATLEEAIGYRLIPPPRDAWFDASAVAIARTVGELAAYGLHPRHLRSFSLAADREVGLFDQAVAPLRQRDGEVAETALLDLAALSVRLHALLIREALHR